MRHSHSLAEASALDHVRILFLTAPPTLTFPHDAFPGHIINQLVCATQTRQDWIFLLLSLEVVLEQNDWRHLIANRLCRDCCELLLRVLRCPVGQGIVGGSLFLNELIFYVCRLLVKIRRATSCAVGFGVDVWVGHKVSINLGDRIVGFHRWSLLPLMQIEQEFEKSLPFLGHDNISETNVWWIVIIRLI